MSCRSLFVLSYFLALDRQTDVVVLSWLMTSQSSYNKDKNKMISDLQRNKENQLE